jgi:hypothetical protein
MIPWQDLPPDPVWQTLYDAVAAILQKVGQEYEDGQGDWYLVDDDTGQDMQKIELVNIDLLRPSLVSALRALLVDHPEWVISLRVDGIDGDGKQVGMGLLICSDRVIDELRREFLPAHVRSMQFD